jgi:Kazal-type serine protease inhibitor domain
MVAGLAITLGVGCGSISGEQLGGAGGRGAGGTGTGGVATGGNGAGGVATGGVGAGGTGGCVGICNDLYDPVCGANGVTYGNSCSATCAGVPIAYQGACADGGVDGGSGSCTVDSDCVLASDGCCGGMCVLQRGLPLPPPTSGCNIACPVSLVPTCGCVNHQCVTQSGTGGHGGNGGTGGAGGMSGASCSDLANQYQAALPEAEACDTNASGQCQQSVSTSLSPCNTGCTIYVTDTSTLNAIQASWVQEGCDDVQVACPAIACRQPNGSGCVAGDGGGGRCQSITVEPSL